MKYELQKSRNAVYLLHAHLIFVTKYRKKIFTKIHLNYMEQVFKDVCKDFDAQLLEFNGESDHVHLLVVYPPKHSISSLVNSLKGVSSRYLRKEFASLSEVNYKPVIWSPSYFAGSVGGAPISILKQYIENQNEPME